MTAYSDGDGNDGDSDDGRERWCWDDQELRFDEADGAYVLGRRAEHNPIVDAILALARMEGLDPLEMTPLYEELAPDVLPHVVAAADRESAVTEEIGFSAYGRTVRIAPDEIRIE